MDYLHVGIHRKCDNKQFTYHVTRRPGVEGNFIKWSNVGWKLKNMEATIIDADEFCHPPFKSDTILFPGPRDFESVNALCSKFHGTMALIRDKTDADYIISQWWAKVNNTGGPEKGNGCERVYFQ